MSRIYELDRDFVHWQILSLVCSPQRNHVTLLLCRQSLSACKDVGYVEGTSVITGPKCDKGPICDTILNPSVVKVLSVINIWTQA